MSHGYVWPVTQNGPVSLQLAEIALGLQYAHRNPGIVSMERLARDIDRVRDMARRQEDCLDSIVADHQAAEQASADLASAQRPARRMAR